MSRGLDHLRVLVDAETTILEATHGHLLVIANDAKTTGSQTPVDVRKAPMNTCLVDAPPNLKNVRHVAR